MSRKMSNDTTIQKGSKKHKHKGSKKHYVYVSILAHDRRKKKITPLKIWTLSALTNVNF